MAGSSTRIAELASTIQRSVQEIDEFLAKNSLPPLSFDVNAPDELPPQLQPVQRKLLEATEELSALVQGPKGMVVSFGLEHNKFASIHAISRLKLAEAVPIGSTATLSQIAETAGLTENDAAQFLRHAITYRIFTEPEPGVVAHTAPSRILATSPVMSNYIQSTFDELLPAAAHILDAMQRWPNSPEPVHAGFNFANNTSDTIFAFMNKNKERATRFARSMGMFQGLPPFSPQHLFDGFDWTAVNKVVDIGGSNGAIAIALAKRFGHLQCVVQDLAHTIGSAEVPEDVADRVKLTVHDFFEEQPIVDADVYLIRQVLHDWSDEFAAKILRRLVPALEKDKRKRIVIQDVCLPEWGTMPVPEQRFIRTLDLVMKAIQNGRERHTTDWDRVISLADPKLVLKEVRRPAGSVLSVLSLLIADS